MKRKIPETLVICMVLK